MANDTDTKTVRPYRSKSAKAGDKLTPEQVAATDIAGLAAELKAIDLKLVDDVENPGGLVVDIVAI